MSLRPSIGGVALAVLLMAATGCGGLGVDPSGHLACSPPPQNACPQGFSCNAGRCWRNGTPDAPVEAPSDSHGDVGNADQPQEMASADVSAADVPTGDAAAEDVATDSASSDLAVDNHACDSSVVSSCGPTCKVCPAPPANGHATCDGTSCGIMCDSSYRNCPGTQVCTSKAAPNCCADTDCPTAMPACVSGQCKARAINDPCSSDTECGSGHCAPTSTGGATKVCCDSACSGSCNNGCAGGTCQHENVRTACGEIDNSYYGPRYYLCDGNGNCNPPAFPCGGGSACAARSDVACCGDPNNNLQPACIAPAACDQGAANFEQSCQATIDCPLGTFCCVIENPDLEITACAANCQTYAPTGFDPAAYAHAQACDYVRDSSCPNGQHCLSSNPFGISKCGL